jgi:hypothetical protein
MKRILFLVFTTLYLSGCEFALDKDFFNEIEEPSNEHQFNLTFGTTQDTIKVFNNTYFTYDINTFGLEILDGYFTLDKEKWDIYSEEGGFNIAPTEFEPGYYTLTLQLRTNSGTGSIADQIGLEGYAIKKEWTLIVDGRPAPVLSITKTITNEGYLKLTWEKCNQYNFNYYELSGLINSNHVNMKIYDPDSTTYFDSSFVGGSINFRVNSCVLSNSCQFGVPLELNESTPTPYIEELGLDSIRIFWDKSPYKCKYKINDSYYNSYDFLNDTSLVIAQPGLGKNTIFYLYTYPINLFEDDYCYTRKNYCTYYLGEKFPFCWSFAYSETSNLVYTNRYNYIESYNVLDINLFNTTFINNLQYFGLFSCPTNSDKVATISSGTWFTDNLIYVFENNSLSEPIIIALEPEPVLYSVDHFFLTNNNLIAIARQGKYELIDISLGKSIGKLIIDDYPIYGKWACFGTSIDGQHMCFVTLNGLRLYNMKDGVFELIFSDTRSYNSVWFDKKNPDQLYISLNNSTTIELRDISDFSLVKSFTMPTNRQVIRNIDPITGYMLLSDFSFVYLVDLESANIIFKVRCGDYAPQIFANRLFLSDGFTLNVANYIKK